MLNLDAVKLHSKALNEPARATSKGRRLTPVWLSISGPDLELDKLRSVKYILHPSFRNRELIAVDRRKNFGVKIWTYGYFKIDLEYMTNDGKRLQSRGFVKFDRAS